MAANLGDLVTEIRSLLRSFTGQHDQATYLTAEAASGALTLSVADGDAVTSGMLEIEDELIWVDQSEGGTLTVPPYGRGYQGTTAATHPINTQILVDPTFPRDSIIRAIQQTSQAVYPKLFWPKATEFTFSPAVGSYELPAEAERVLGVTAETVGASKFWTRIDRYRFDADANTTAFTTGRALHLREAPAAGRKVRVLYAAPFGEMTLSSDTLAAAGHAESHRDLLVFGAAARLIQFLEPGRLSLNSVENQERSKFGPPGSASALTRQLLGWYENRLTEERSKLLGLYPMSRTFRTR